MATTLATLVDASAQAAATAIGLATMLYGLWQMRTGRRTLRGAAGDARNPG